MFKHVQTPFEPSGQHTAPGRNIIVVTIEYIYIYMAYLIFIYIYIYIYMSMYLSVPNILNIIMFIYNKYILYLILSNHISNYYHEKTPNY